MSACVPRSLKNPLFQRFIASLCLPPILLRGCRMTDHHQTNYSMSGSHAEAVKHLLSPFIDDDTPFLLQQQPGEQLLIPIWQDTIFSQWRMQSLWGLGVISRKRETVYDFLQLKNLLIWHSAWKVINPDQLSVFFFLFFFKAPYISQASLVCRLRRRFDCKNSCISHSFSA